jgi:hypothetical protein
MNERKIRMNPGNPNDALDELIATFSAVELQQRALHNEALDMEDDEIAKATLGDTYAKIRRIKAWLKTLSALKDEVAGSEIFQAGNLQAKNSQLKNPPAATANAPEKPDALPKPPAGNPVKAQEDLTGKKPSAFSLFEKAYPVKFWHEIPIKVCEVMIIKKPFVIANLDKEADLNPGERARFSYREDEIKNNKTRLSNDLWMDTTCDAGESVALSRGILTLCGFGPDDLSIEYK